MTTCARTARSRNALTRTAAALLLLGSLTLAACSDDLASEAELTPAGEDVDATDAEATDAGGSAPTVGEPAFPVTVASGQLPDTTEVTIEEQPTSIVSLSPTATEMLFAVGAGDQVVAVDEFSYYPEEAPVTDLSGFEPNLEAILGYSPDLVVTQGGPDDLAAGLDAAGVPTLELPAAAGLDEAYSQIERVGAATGHLLEAVQLTTQMQEDIEAAVASTDGAGEGLTYYHELDPSFFSASEDTFIGQVYGLFGMENITESSESTDLYPQLSQEFIITADPDVIFVTSGDFSASPEEIAARPGWDQVTAVEQDAVVVVDADTASRWGPRVVDFTEDVASLLNERQTADVG